MSDEKHICCACGQEVDPCRIHLSDIDDKHFKLDGQKIVMKGWVGGQEVETTIGVFIPDVMGGLAPAIVGALNRYTWMALDEQGDLREDQVTV